MLQSGMGSQDRVVRLNDGSRDLEKKMGQNCKDLKAGSISSQ